MKKRFLFQTLLFATGYQASALGAQVVPGVFKVTGAAVAYRNPVLVLNHVPNENLSNDGGYNYLYTDTADSNKLKTSRKKNPLYRSAIATPLVPEFVPANYYTVEEALEALDAGTNTVDA